MLIMSLCEQPKDGTFAYNEGPLLRKTKWMGPLLRMITVNSKKTASNFESKATQRKWTHTYSEVERKKRNAA